MGELVDRDVEHLRLLRLGFYIMAGMTGLMSLFSLLWVGMGVLFTSGAFFPANASPSGDPRAMGVFFLVVGLVVLLLGLATTYLTFLTGRYLGNRRHSTFCMVMAGLCCLQIPWGTVIGVCTIMVLSRPSVKGMFGHNQLTTPIP
jgi:hypothetical protein